MNKLYIFPPFHYKPLKLVEEVGRLQNKYKYKGQVSDSVIRKKLPELLAQIRNLKNEREEIIKFASKLKRIDISILSSEYPYENEDKTTASKIIIILTEKYNTIVGTRFWSHYQQLPYDQNVVQILSYVFQQENENFLALKPSLRKNYNNIFNGNDPKNIINRLAEKIGSPRKIISKSMEEYKIEKESRLANEIWLRALTFYLKEPWFIASQGADVIVEYLRNIDLKTYKTLLSKYLDANDYSQYDEKLLKQVIDRLKDPREDTQRWDGIPETVIKKVKSYLLERYLYLFFSEDNDSERFAYWKRYIHLMEDIDIVSEPPIAAMYFSGFVVVEFANKGNAAYFYEEVGFSRYLAYKIKRDVRESELKDTRAAYFIHKLNHSGDWPSRYAEYMTNYLQGNFSYRH